MKTVTLAIDDQVSDKFLWLLEHFSPNEIRILEQSYDGDDLTSVGDPTPPQGARDESRHQGTEAESLDAFRVKRLAALDKVLRLANAHPIERGDAPWNRESLHER
ncbi:hypothetical protein G3480_06010 [Thiorhodococcus mannitoliphagus]|uniref:Uncharacterized protein n=1 Tax=Thiorhodococcus mannitoliphagus TaxID=329406 RepID=A0A6P1DV01_9GAMM|nr:hypothetical protein [Thiorhodococcus mannitoliphagus]NEX19872.1 hypothetical protein [Thiorhodococcus mannitoliphagus]